MDLSTEQSQPTKPREEEKSESELPLKLLLTALTALGQRFVVALSRLFSIITIGSAFWLWLICLPSPTIPQLVGLGLYAMFILAMHVVVKR